MTQTVEGTKFQVINNEFKQCFVPHAKVERLWTGTRWAEGPAWFPAGRYLIWSDIPNNRIMRWDETDNNVSIFRQPANNTNGNTVDNQGRLISCEHKTRRITRTEHNGTIKIIANTINKKKLNSPNDVVVKSDGSIWFTDPNYGIISDYEGDVAKQEIKKCNVYRIDPKTKKITEVAGEYHKPNGLAFSPDEKYLYVADTGGTHKTNGPRHIKKHAVTKNGTKISKGKIFAKCTNGFFDGFRCDKNGRIWTSAEDGVHCINPNGKLIGKIKIPEIVSNLCFGGPKLNRLFITATTSLYAVYLNVSGVK